MNLYFYASKILTPLILPSNFLIFTLVIFFYLGIYRNKDKFKKIFFVIFIIFSSISLFPIGENLIFYMLEKNYKKNKLPKSIDYIFVPSGSSERIVQAIKIKKQYLPAKVKIIYSSGNSALDSNKGIDSEAPFVEIIINNLNINKKDIIFLPNARNTIENFKQLNHYLGKDSDKKILLITSPSHMKRSLIIGKKNNIKVYGFSSNFYTKNSSFSLINYYQNINFMRNLSYFDKFFKELIGIFIVKIIL